MKDIFGNIIHLDDQVAMVQPGYKNLVLGIVTKITAQKLRVRWKDHNGWEHDMLREQNQVIVNVPSTL